MSPSQSSRLLNKLSRETSSGRFIPEMDGLRFVAIGLVVLFHLNGYLQVKSPVEFAASPDTSWLALVATQGRRGVELFFVISGFILGLPFAMHHVRDAAPVSLGKYYLRRLTRLEPPYLFTLLTFVVLHPLVEHTSIAAQLPHLAASAVYMHNLIYGVPSTVLGVAWSLEIEVQFYVLVPVLTLLFAVRDPRVRRATLLLSVGLVLALQEIFLPQRSVANLTILAYLQFFLTGFVLVDIYVSDWRESPRHTWWWDAVTLGGWPTLFVVLRSPALTHWLFPLLLLLLFCAAFRGRASQLAVTQPWITAIGGMCYSMYLIHYEVISLVGRFSMRLATGWAYWLDLMVQVTIVGACVVVVTALYYVVLEKPCMRRDWPQRLRARLVG